MAELLEIDPTSEDAANVAFALEDPANGIRVGFGSSLPQYPPPDRDPMTAGSADTEGDIYLQSRYKNRTITVPVKITKSTSGALDTAVAQLEQKVAKLAREKGTLKRTYVSGNVIVFDIEDASIDPDTGWLYQNRNCAMAVITFTAKPFGRGTEQTLGGFSFTGVGSAVFTGVGGDVAALGRLLITEGAGADQWHMHYGVRSRNYNSGTTSALIFEAETLLPQGGAVVAALSGASGGTAIHQGTLTSSYQSMMSFAKAAGTVYPQHIGDYNVWARLYRPASNAGTVSVALEWAEGDFTRFTRNAEIVYDADEREGDFTLAYFGQIHLGKVKKGNQRWDGHLIAKSSTTGDDLDVDKVWLQPISETAAEVTAVVQVATPTLVSARDEFDQAAGNLNAKTLPVGGSWATSGATTDLVVDAGTNTVTRSATSGGRFAVASLAASTAQAVQIDCKIDSLASDGERLLIARRVDSSNQLLLHAVNSSGSVFLEKYIATSPTTLAVSSSELVATVDTWTTIRLAVFANGAYAVWVFPAGGTAGDPLILGQDSALATGGTLASGQVGFGDSGSVATTNRSYDNFKVWAPPADAALFASKQAELRHDSYVRQDSAGAVWAPKSVEGDYLLFPPSGREVRSDELLLRFSRGDPATMRDSALDPVSGTAYATPRYLNIPA